MENRTSVYSTTSEQEAIIFKDRLVADGIDAIVLDMKDHVTELVGTFDIFVINEDAERAKVILKEIEG
ncbi:MAG: DUF2007 domain-containing protein [Crocinitomicaceae bacterium]|nr:DUF2007 domain-containing protein [Crocinitomicaceae bacterium]